MTDTQFYLALAVAGLAAIAMLSMATLTGWRGWLQFKRDELEHKRAGRDDILPGTGQRIEIADLKERIRKLEAIAAGVDL